MSTWMNDAVPNHNGNGFPHMNDPNAANAGAMMDPSAFLANSAQAQAQAQAQFNSAQQQFNQSQQQQQQMPAPMRNASPSFQNPVYQTNSVIPSKRPRPREDSLAGSPRQNPGMLPTSRSETPQQQSFAGYQPGAVPQQNPGQFPHLQPNGSANASPSPIMGNQMRPGSVPQRVATASPHPFSPSAQQFGQQASPIPSEHGTPQPNPYMQNLPQGFNPNYAPSPSNARPSPNPNAMAASQMMAQQMGQMPQHMNQMQNSMYPPQMQQQQQAMQQQAQQQGQQPQPGQPQSQQQSQQRLQGMSDQQKMAAYQMRLQQQLQGGPQLQAQMQAQNMGRGMVPKQQMPGMANGQMPQGAMRPQQRMMAVASPEQFMKNLTTLMNAKGLPLDTNPMIGDRPVNLMMLFQAVQGRGGYKVVTASNTWPHIAQMIGLQPQIPTVPPTLKQIYERNLYKFEEVWMAQQKQRLMQQQHAQNQQGQQQPQQQPSQQQPQQPPTPQHQQSMNIGNQATPQKPMQSMPQMVQGQMMQPGQQPQMQQQQTPMKSMQPPVNGFSTPQLQNMPQPNMMPGHNRNSLSVDPAGPNDMAMASPAPRRVGSMGQNDGRQAAATVHEQRMPRLGPQSEEYSPCSRELSTYGGVDLNAFSKLGAELERWKPDIPPIQELGNIDIGALTRSLQSGIHGEVRLALDVLAAISCSNMPAHVLQLRYCDDLVDALIECAEEQVDMLAEHTVEVSDEIQITPYEDVLRACRIERCSIREIPVFGTTEYQLEKAVDRIICITTILRNVSFPGEQNDNHHFLADELVIKFLCVVIRYLGTRNMLLRSHNNTLDFMKDVVVLLSNIAGSIEIPGREQAYCLLQFLLAFAPSPNPTVSDGTLFFTPYEPSLHPYLPHAVDALAKLLARDVPNRTHYKTVFALDSGSTPYELLTRAFALAICPLPDKGKQQVRPPNFPSLVEVRKPFLMQGLLAADILASVAPGPDTGVTKAWLACDNGLSQNLFRLVRELSQLYESPQIHGGPRMPPRKDPELVYIVMVAISLLRRLVEKSGDPNDPTVKIPADFIPSPQSLLDAMSMPSPEWGKEGLLQHLLAIFKLGK